MIGFDPQQFKTMRANLLSLKRTAPQRLVRKHAYFLMWAFVILSIGVFFLPWQQTAIGNGRVIAYSPSEREQDINAPINGRIASWGVVEGQHLKKGDLIVELQDIDPEHMHKLNSEREAIYRRMEATRKAAQTAKRNFDRQKELFEKGLAARRQFEKAELDYMGYLADEAEANAGLARVDVRLARQLTRRVFAATDGIISRIVAGQGGQIVKQGDLLAILVPENTSRTVELWLDGNDLPLIAPGREVRLQFEGWPAIQFGGWPSVAVGTFGGEVAVMDPVNGSDGRFRIFIRPQKAEEWPDKNFLRQGVRVNGWVLLNQVSLGYEIWRQLNGFPPSMGKPPDGDRSVSAKSK